MSYNLLKIHKMTKILLLLCISLLTACVNFGRPNQVGTGRYLVKPTDTLYSVAWRYDVDVKKLAAWNQIQAPFKIKPGQYLRLRKPQNFISTVAITDQKTLNSKQYKKTIKKKNNQPITWIWPTHGKILNKFSFKDINKRGVDIASKVRQPIVAVSDGKVVYSGNGLEGYKNLIIIKHNETYLSAYAQNKNLLVKEGDVVKKGKVIAAMGMDKNNGFLLHFQIRKNGKPIDPMRFLPKQKK